MTWFVLAPDAAAFLRAPRPAHRILDNLPIGMVRMRDDNGEQVKTYERGFPVGFMDVSAAEEAAAGLRLWENFNLVVLQCAATWCDVHPWLPVAAAPPPPRPPCLPHLCAEQRQGLPKQPPVLHHPVPQGGRPL